MVYILGLNLSMNDYPCSAITVVCSIMKSSIMPHIFVVVKNGGKVDYQYGEFLRAMGGWPRFSPNKSTGPSAKWDPTLGDFQNDGSSSVGRQHGETTAIGIRNGNPSTMDEGESENLGIQPKF